ncbi:minor capsid protein [Capybara microvirus Cap3_SP_668]|nr:minor capsid protein [Capybara microvirus Cap3_SP_668]
MSILGAIGGIASSLLGGALSQKAVNATNQANIQMVRETNQANMDLAKYQNEANYNLWREQMAYNTPSEMMKRYEDAGLNPNLIYNSGASASAASSPPTMERATMLSPHQEAYKGYDAMLQNAYSSVYDSLLKESALQTQHVNRDMMYQDTLNKALDGFQKQLQNERSQMENKVYLDSMSWLVDAKKYQVEHLMRENYQMDLQNQIKETEVSLLPLRKKMTYAQFDKLQKEVQILGFTSNIKEFESQLSKVGLRPQDPIWYRELLPLLEPLLEKLKTGFSKLINKF